MSGRAEYATWLTDDTLLIVGSLHSERRPLTGASLILGDRSISLEARSLSYPRTDLPGTSDRIGTLLTARILGFRNRQGPLGRLLIQAGATTLALNPSDLSEALTDLQSLLRNCLAGLDFETRADVLEFLVAALRGHRQTTNVFRLSKSLYTIREALRERLPYCVVARDQPQGLAVDAIFAIDERSFYMRGWMRDEEATISGLTAVSPEGSRAELFDTLFRYHRPDVEKLYAASSNAHLREKKGFICYFTAKAPSYLITGWTVEMRDTAGVAVEVAGPPVIGDVIAVRSSIISDLTHERPPGETFMLKHVLPAISRLHERYREMVHVETSEQYGTPDGSPEVSIIVPLDQSMEFLEVQLAEFVHDREIHRADLIYIFTSPGAANRFKDAAARLFKLYRVPFRTLTLSQEVGFAIASDIGVSAARGRLLLLLNPNVLPDRPGWLATMAAFYDSTGGIGALGSKLLYEDDSLEHAGMGFSGQSGSHVWERSHYFRGLHRRFPPANVARRVPAISHACLMVDRDLYKRVGGLRGIYALGEHEDSDLCLRLMMAGYQNWYLPDAELYHIEGRSQPSPLRDLSLRYDAWLQTRLWGNEIQAVIARDGPCGAG